MAPCNLYHWQSAALSAYSSGNIVSIGRDIEEARANARAGFAKVVEDHWGDQLYGLDDEDDKAFVAGKLAQLEADIAREPHAIGNVVFIRGGE